MKSYDLPPLILGTIIDRGEHYLSITGICEKCENR